MIWPTCLGWSNALTDFASAVEDSLVPLPATPSSRLAPVTSLVAYEVRIPLRKRITHASHSRAESDNVVVRCELSNGVVGVGEGVPREYVTGETLSKSVELLKQTDWDEQFKYAPDDWADAVRQAEDLSLAKVDEDRRNCVGNAARCAAELALLDAYGKHFGVPMHELMLALPELREMYDPRAICRYSGAITSKKSLKREIFSMCRQKLWGFRAFKVKVGTEGQDDPRRLEVIRKIISKRCKLRIDANEAWAPDDLLEKLKPLARFNLIAVEQPVRHEDVAKLANVRPSSPVPIMLDESLCSKTDATLAIDEGWCDLFNLRLSKCGGLIPTLKLAAQARKAGLGYQLGCQVGETGILSAAGRAVACSLRDPIALEGSYDAHLVKERLTHENITFYWGGFAPRLTKPGLGITLDPKRLEKVQQAKHVLFQR